MRTTTAGWEAVIGLEVHVQLRTATKLFCACRNAYGEAPNSLTCPVCLGLPGALPVLNDGAVKLALALGLALHGHVQPRSTFYRKHYVYPDLPKGYQITQGPVALVEGGWLVIPGDPAVRGAEGPVRIGIARAHLEEDSGKSSHDPGLGASLVDLNRAGVPLVEIVGRPELRSAQEASDYLKALHHLVGYLGICDGALEEGSLRCDANVSVRRAGSEAFGTRVEIKNLNSFRFLRQALDFEFARQVASLERGETLRPETRGWDAAAGETRPQRGKEEAADYRYLPEPDLPTLEITPGELGAVRAALPELPEARRERLRAAHGLRPQDAELLVQSPAFADYFEAAAAASGHGQATAHWMLGELSRILNARGCTLEALGLPPEQLGALVALVEARELSHGAAKERVLPALLAGEGTPRELMERFGLSQVSDPGAIRDLVDRVLQAHPEQVAQLRAGRTALRGFLVGQILKASGGKADPRRVQETLDLALADR